MLINQDVGNGCNTITCILTSWFGSVTRKFLGGLKFVSPAAIVRQAVYKLQVAYNFNVKFDSLQFCFLVS